MTHILIAPHDGMAEGMMQSAKMLVEEQGHLGYVTFGEEMGSDELDELYGEKITNISPNNQYPVLCDTKGGMPPNAVSRYPFKNEDVAIIYGMNLSTLIEAIAQCGNPDIRLKDLTEYSQQRNGSTIGLGELQDRTQETKVRSPSIHNGPPYQARGRPR